MTTWILILAIYSANNIAITHIDIESEKVCIAAGEKFKRTQHVGGAIEFVCVKGWEITND